MAAMTPLLTIVLAALALALVFTAFVAGYLFMSFRKLDDVLEAQTATQQTIDRLVAAMGDSQAWYWTPEWQAGEREASDDLAAGRFTRYNSLEAMEAALDAEDPLDDQARAGRRAVGHRARSVYGA